MTKQLKKYNKYFSVFLLILLIIIQSFLLIYIFSVKRQGFHSDENWSYGFANSYYQPHIHIDNDKKATNIEEWKDSSILRDYIEVREDQRFCFDSVCFNMSENFSPPLHSILLHGICSFFPNSFSWWYGFSINIIAFIISQLLLFFIAKELFHSTYIAFLTCAFYGFSFAAINCFIFIRTYALLTCLALAFIYLLLQLQNSSHIKKHFLLIYVVTIMGCLSHYYYYAFAFFLSFSFCIQLLVQKKYRLLIKYAATMVLAVISSLIIFPSTIKMVLDGSSLYNVHMPLSWEIKSCINLIFVESLGFIPKYPDSITWCILGFSCVFLTIILSGFLFLFRNEKWLKEFLGTIPAKIYSFFSKITKKKFNPIWLSLVFCLNFTLILIAKISNIFMMGLYSDRYLFFLIPIFDLCVIKVIVSILHFTFKHRRVIIRPIFTLLLASSLLLVHSNNSTHYYFERNTNAPTLTTLTKDANVIVTLGTMWNYVCYTTLLRDSKNIFAFCPSSDQGLNHLKSALEGLNNAAPVYIIMDKSFLGEKKENIGSFKIDESGNTTSKFYGSGYSESDLLNFFSSCSWATSKEYVQTENSFQGELVIYRLR